MQVVAATPASSLLPFEKTLLHGVAAALGSDMGARMSQQIASINQVHRLLDWKTTEFRSRRFFREKWPANALFARRDQHPLAQALCAFGNKEVTITVWAEGGHVCRLEAPVGMSGLSISGPFTVVSTRIIA